MKLEILFAWSVLLAAFSAGHCADGSSPTLFAGFPQVGATSGSPSLPTADELRKLKDAMAALVRCFDSPPALPPAPVAPREGRPSVSHSPAGGGR
ncbi:MAG: hypothetical protein HY814_11000 [Candidatus Riflebacteria bacterium]|nr:hypothetical protein [Candidatus Riflebacteria bacterium]